MSQVVTGEILTLAEAATYLRVSETALEKLAEHREVPCQKIADDWRFLKEALNAWLTDGRRFEPQLPKPNLFDVSELPTVYRLLKLLEKQPQEKPTEPKRGSKELLLKHVGMRGTAEEIEAFLQQMRALRDEAG